MAMAGGALPERARVKCERFTRPNALKMSLRALFNGFGDYAKP